MDSIQSVINELGLSDNPIWDISLYVLFFFNLIMLLLLPDGATMHTMLIIFVLISIFIDKTFAFGHFMNSGKYDPETCHAKIFVGTYLIRAVIFIAPLIIAGSTDEGKVRGLGILNGALGATYMLGRWYMDQRDVDTPEITCMSTGIAVHAASMFIVLGYVMVRRSLHQIIVELPR